jgi:anti-sigma factor RsiW
VLWGCEELGRPFAQHIDNRELNALVPSSSENGHRLPALSPDALRKAEHHVRTCADCSNKVSKYRQLVNMASIVAISDGAPSAAGCTKDEEVDWHEVVTGQWPELKAKQLIMHAAFCDHCGPLLRAAASMDDNPTAEEEKMLAELAAPTQPLAQARRELLPQSGPPSIWRKFRSRNVLLPAAGLALLLGLLIGLPRLSSKPLSGPNYAEFAATAHRQHVEGKLPLEVHSASQQTINEWFKAYSRFPLALPASPAAAGEARPFRLEGARLVKVAGKPAAFIAYEVWTPKLQMTPASLIVTRDSVALASGGLQVDFEKVSFHYSTAQGYKVVTWSMHGLTYALVSQETNNTQASCMVCHSALRDRDLSHTPAPLHTHEDPSESVFQ